MPALNARLEFVPNGSPDPGVLACEAEVFGHWYGDTRTALDEDFSPYDGATVFLQVLGDDGQALGFARIITPGPGGLKTLHDVAKPPWGIDDGRAVAETGVDPRGAWDIGTIGVRRELGGRGALIAAAIYHGIIAGTRANGVPWILAMVDEKVRKIFHIAGLIMEPLPGTAAERYYGSPATTPMYANVERMVARQRREFPKAYRRITLGLGLPGVRLPSPDAYLLPAVQPAVVDLTDRAARSGGIPAQHAEAVASEPPASV